MVDSRQSELSQSDRSRSKRSHILGVIQSSINTAAVLSVYTTLDETTLELSYLSRKIRFCKRRFRRLTGSRVVPSPSLRPPSRFPTDWILAPVSALRLDISSSRRAARPMEHWREKLPEWLSESLEYRTAVFIASTIALASLISFHLGRKMEGVLEKLEGHRSDSPMKGLASRWSKKWVSCDGEELCYYKYTSAVQEQVEKGGPGEGPNGPKSPLGSRSRSLSIEEDHEPRKVLHISTCQVKVKKRLLQIEVFGEYDGKQYDITFKCQNEVEFGAWSNYFYSVGGSSWYSWYRRALKVIPIPVSFTTTTLALALVVGINIAGHYGKETILEAYGKLRAVPTNTTTST